MNFINHTMEQGHTISMPMLGNGMLLRAFCSDVMINQQSFSVVL